MGIFAVAGFWWKSDAVKHLAMDEVNGHCREQGLQLLDQTMVIRSIWPVRGIDGGACLRRRYSFEFTSTGEERYRGMITMAGTRREALELEPYMVS